MKPLSVTDIAREAGVPIATVSRVVNGSDTVAPDTCRRIERVIERHGLELRSVTAELRRGRGRAIGIAVADLSQPWYVMLSRSLRGAAEAHGLTTVVYDVQHSDEVLLSQLRRAQSHHLIGMVIATADRLDPPRIRRALEHTNELIPLVVIGQPLSGVPWATVRFDDSAASESATHELLQRREAPILFMGGNERSYLTQVRRAGVCRALEKHAGLAERSMFVKAEPTTNFQAGYQLTMELQEKLGHFGSIFCANDELALGASRAVKDMGLDIPNDLMVIGFGDVDFLPYLAPSLSSVGGDIEAVADDVLEAILAGRAGERVFSERVHARQLQHRESTTLSGCSIDGFHSCLQPHSESCTYMFC